MAADEGRFDVIVIGAGIQGSCTAYTLARRNKRVLLLEQFPLPHSRGSSHGQSRIIRKAYEEDHFAEMMQEAYRLWHDIEAKSKTQLYVKTGMLAFGPPDDSYITGAVKAFEKWGYPYTKLNHEEFVKAYPQINVPNNYVAVLDPDAGILKANKCLKAIQQLFIDQGGALYDGETVKDIRPGHTIFVTTNKGKYSCNNLVITAGPWTPKLIKPLGLNLPLQPQAITVGYWKDVGQGHYKASAGFPGGQGHYKASAGFPIFIASHRRSKDVKSSDIYGLPSYEYPSHTKICLHSGRDIDDPEQRDDVIDGKDVDIVKQFVTDVFPGLENRPSIVERCMYTVTPDGGFVLDVHPHWKNIVIGAGFSGTGFKLGPVVGAVLSDLVCNNKPKYDMKPFSISRFFNPKSQL